jgi:3-phenylpropionate/trans-cinnamate dioxygenase ferredoxin subunit
MSEFVTVAQLDEIPEDGLVCVEHGGQDLVVVKCAGTVYALEDRCSHEEFPLSAGELVGCELTCALHGARFDLATGAPRALPAVVAVKTFEVQIEGNEVRVKLDG